MHCVYKTSLISGLQYLCYTVQQLEVDLICHSHLPLLAMVLSTQVSSKTYVILYLHVCAGWNPGYNIYVILDKHSRLWVNLWAAFMFKGDVVHRLSMYYIHASLEL